MSSNRDGGAAFPRPGFTENEYESQEGMSLRDYFAGQALAGVMQLGFNSEDSAEQAYKLADAMLKAREA